jgi:hypothetical protein
MIIVPRSRSLAVVTSRLIVLDPFLLCFYREMPSVNNDNFTFFPLQPIYFIFPGPTGLGPQCIVNQYQTSLCSLQIWRENAGMSRTSAISCRFFKCVFFFFKTNFSAIVSFGGTGA